MRKTCPECKSPLIKPSMDELQDLGNKSMERVVAARAYLDSRNHSPDYESLKLVAFMDIVEGKKISKGEAQRMIS